jgi:Flp pilus assembly protein protease CpaA
MLPIYIITILLGGIVGLLLQRLTLHLINSRTNSLIENSFYKKILNPLFWIAFNSISWLVIIYIGGLNLSSIEVVLVLSACLSLSVVDIIIRKIPNELILSLFIVAIIFIFINNKFATINLNLMGLLIGFILFLLPSFIGKTIGMGDIKLSGAVGFCLGTYNYFLAIATMGALVIPYLAYILISGKGNLKTKIAYGPFMAAGLVIIMLYKIIII